MRRVFGVEAFSGVSDTLQTSRLQLRRVLVLSD